MVCCVICVVLCCVVLLCYAMLGCNRLCCAVLSCSGMISTTHCSAVLFIASRRETPIVAEKLCAVALLPISSQHIVIH